MNRSDFVSILRHNGLCKDVAEYAFNFMAPPAPIFWENVAHYNIYMPWRSHNLCEGFRLSCAHQIEYVQESPGLVGYSFYCAYCLKPTYFYPTRRCE